MNLGYLYGQAVTQNDGRNWHGREDHSKVLNCLLNMGELPMESTGTPSTREDGMCDMAGKLGPARRGEFGSRIGLKHHWMQRT